MRSRGAAAVLAAVLASAAAGGCSETSPAGDELASPAERDATPLAEPALERTEPERKQERLEEFGVAEPEPGDESP